MLNTPEPPSADQLAVIDYANPHVAERMANGKMNTPPDTVLANIRSSVRRGHPQMRPNAVRQDQVCIVGSGPSLRATETDLRDLLWSGAHLVTLNGAYQWAIARNFKPNTQVVMDARPSNARFVQPYVERCNYVLASQCAPALWDAVATYRDVWIFHAVVKGEEDASAFLDEYYGGNWMGVVGGTTVASRAITLLRMAGYVRFHLFGIDCCWMDGAHHAIPQPENDRDDRFAISYGLTDQPETQRQFTVSSWHLKQFEDLLTIMKVNGTHFTLNVHGDGLFAHAMRTLGGTVTAAVVPQER